MPFSRVSVSKAICFMAGRRGRARIGDEQFLQRRHFLRPGNEIEGAEIARTLAFGRVGVGDYFCQKAGGLWRARTPDDVPAARRVPIRCPPRRAMRQRNSPPACRRRCPALRDTSGHARRACAPARPKAPAPRANGLWRSAMAHSRRTCGEGSSISDLTSGITSSLCSPAMRRPVMRRSGIFVFQRQGDGSFAAFPGFSASRKSARARMRGFGLLVPHFHQILFRTVRHRFQSRPGKIAGGKIRRLQRLDATRRRS